MSLWRAVAVTAVAAVASIATALFFRMHPASGPGFRAPIDVSYSDFLAISLTAVTVVLAVLAVIVAVVAWVTVKEIKLAARRIAHRSSRAGVTTEMKKMPEQLQKFVEGQLPAVLAAEVQMQLDRMAVTGQLAQLVERAQLGRAFYDPTTDQELNPGFEKDEGDR